MHSITALALVISLLACRSSAFWPFASASTGPIKRVAIIGAGAAGSSTAYHLRRDAAAAGVPVNITIYERQGYIGGRSTTVHAYGDPLEPVELGASIFVEVNSILRNASREFGLRPRDAGSGVDEILGIWDGRTFVYTQKDSGWQYWDVAKLLWKYGLAPLRTQRLMKATVGKFLKLYEYPFFPFRSLTSRAYDLGLVDVTSQTGEQFLTANSIGAPFTTDIIQASTRVNYGQNLNLIHGLEAMVCMAISGAMSIAGGNWQIFDGMVARSNATVHLNTTVNSISKSKGRYRIKSSSADLATSEYVNTEDVFDTVVLAAPMQFTNISFDAGVLKHTPDVIPYVQLHVTLFTTPLTLNPSFFNITPGSEMPNTILTTLPKGEVPTKPEESVGLPGFFSISTLRTVVNPRTLEKEYLYKIFSPKAVTSEFLTGILGADSQLPLPTSYIVTGSLLMSHAVPSDLSTSNSSIITWYYPHVWYSYPYELPRVTFEDSALATGFYYTAGIESFISTMETSALMGKNVARLVVNDFQELEEQKIDGGQAVLHEKERIPEL